MRFKRGLVAGIFIAGVINAFANEPINEPPPHELGPDPIKLAPASPSADPIDTSYDDVPLNDFNSNLAEHKGFPILVKTIRLATRDPNDKIIYLTAMDRIRTLSQDQCIQKQVNEFRLAEKELGLAEAALRAAMNRGKLGIIEFHVKDYTNVNERVKPTFYRIKRKGITYWQVGVNLNQNQPLHCHIPLRKAKIVSLMQKAFAGR